MKALMTNQGGVADELRRGRTRGRRSCPRRPGCRGGRRARRRWRSWAARRRRRWSAPAAGEGAPWLWVVRARTGGTWHTAVLPGSQGRYAPPGGRAPDEVLVFGVDRTGREGPTARAAAAPAVAAR